tara:strand:- start:167 stop:586 length:420 start_codon:yes stop_codon:yes gene_type:complete
MSAEDLHEQIATLKLLVATQKENIEFLTDEAGHLAKKLAKVESENDYDLTHKCAFTDNGMIDDCGIEIHFGYGSNRDMESYVIKNVSDGMGEKVLKFLNDNFVNGNDVRDFLRENSLAKKEDVDLPTDTTIYNATNHIQ